MCAAVANAANSTCCSLTTMSDDMTEKYRIFRRASGVWYLEDKEIIAKLVNLTARKIFHAVPRPGLTVKQGILRKQRNVMRLETEQFGSLLRINARRQPLNVQQRLCTFV